ACREHGIRALVYTSSPSVVADGSNLRGVDESRPYPDRYKAYYPQTKAIAERAVLAANSDRLKTCALRPHLIWGPGDTNLVPTILSKAKTGRLVQVGEGQNLVDLSFIEDCVEAHLAAGESLLAHDARAAGKAYFISQGEPVKMWHWINEVLKRNGVHPITKRVSFRFADTAALFLETMSRLSPIPFEPPLTRFLVSEMATDHYFSIRAAQRDFGYQPRFSIEEALDITFPRVLADSSQRRLFAVGL
ncbi:MAG: NAD-dependent epimerase/dehydratase family protein, partial [Bdellovibrionales bacterium]|nr:NAD-dependent epimerase/dehydratase family protein [Bdellovibrionales bacterium]